MTTEDMRAQYIGGDFNLAWRLKVEQEAFRFTLGRSYALPPSGAAEADSSHDWGGQRVLWGDVAQLTTGQILRLWNTATWGDTAQWYYAYDGSDCALSAGPTVEPYTRAGLVGLTLGWYAFYIEATTQLLKRVALLPDTPPTWGTPSPGLDLAAAGLAFDSLCACPVSGTDVFLIGLKDNLLWSVLCQLVDGAWTTGPLSRLAYRDDFAWPDGLNGDAERLVIGGNNVDVLTVPMGPDGQNMAVIHQLDPANSDLNSGSYSTPYFMLASPQEDMGRRVWVNGLAQLNGRLWAVVWNELEGDPGFFYAGHTALLSSADGRAWTDEGFLTQYDVRGKLLQQGTTLAVASYTSYMSMPATHRFANPDPATSWYASGIQGLTVTHGGQRSTAELRITAQKGWQAAVEPGLRVTYELGAFTVASGGPASGTPEYATQFVGLIDQPLTHLSLGVAQEEWLCRGMLGRMIGESAYRPPTALWFAGRRTFTSHFLEQGLAAASLAAMSGYWLAEKLPAVPPVAAYGRLKCAANGLAAVPLLLEWPDLALRVDMDTPKGLQIVLWNAEDDETFDQNYWRVGLDGTTLVCDEVVAGVATRRATQATTGYTAGDRGWLAVRVRPATLQVTFQHGATTETWNLNSLWSIASPRTPARPVRWRAGVYADVNLVSFTGNGLNDATFYVPPGNLDDDPARPALTYVVEIQALGAETDKYRWGVLGGNGSATWSASDQEITDYSQLLENDVTVGFGALTGHTVGDRWTVPYPHPEAHLYEVTLCSGEEPVTVGDVLTRCAAIAGVTTELDPATAYVPGTAEDTYPVLDYIDVTLDISAAGNILQIGTDAHILAIGATSLTFHGQTYGGFAWNFPLTLRVVANDNVLSVHRAGHPVASWYFDTSVLGGRVKPLGLAAMTVYPLYWPVDETWWDYNQPASSLLERVLDRRRVYLYEDPDGVVRVSEVVDRGRLIDADVSVGGHTYYQRAVMRAVQQVDARGIVGLVQIVGDGSPGTRVALLEPEALQYGMRTLTVDNPWARTELDTLREARRQLDDFWRQIHTREVTGFWDPLMRIGQSFVVHDGTALWTGITREYEHELIIDGDRVAHTATWIAERVQPIKPHGHWVKSAQYVDEPSEAYPDYPSYWTDIAPADMPAGPVIAVPPQTTLTGSKYNQTRWK